MAKIQIYFGIEPEYRTMIDRLAKDDGRPRSEWIARQTRRLLETGEYKKLLRNIERDETQRYREVQSYG